MDLLRYFHTSPLRVFRSRDHGVNPLQLRHTAFRFPGREWVAPGGAHTCKFLINFKSRGDLRIPRPVRIQLRPKPKNLAVLLQLRVQRRG